MTCWILVPVKAPDACKTRLRGVLDDGARRDLVAAMLRHVVGAAQVVPGVECVAILGPSRHGLPAAVPLVADAGAGFNSALADALPAVRDRIDRLVIVSADLPRVTADEIARLVRLAPDEIGIAPDRAGVGTNALSLPLPAASTFFFAFGPASFARHRAEAARLGLVAQPIDAPGLALDVDEPADLAFAHITI